MANFVSFVLLAALAVVWFMPTKGLAPIRGLAFLCLSAFGFYGYFSGLKRDVLLLAVSLGAFLGGGAILILEIRRKRLISRGIDPNAKVADKAEERYWMR